MGFALLDYVWLTLPKPVAQPLVTELVKIPFPGSDNLIRPFQFFLLTSQMSRISKSGLLE